VAKELGRLQKAVVFDIITFSATFEGPSAVPSLLTALRAARDLTALDALMIVRGGGASSGLATLANE
jgi:exonuclease VII large subunit